MKQNTKSRNRRASFLACNISFHGKWGKKNGARSEASKNKVLKFRKSRVEKKMKFLPTVLGKTLQILLGKGRWREVLLAVRAPRLPVRGPSLFLRFAACFASVFPSSHSSRSPASLVSQPCVKVGKTRPTQRPLQSRYAEQGGKKKTRQKTRLRGEKCHNVARRHGRHRRGTTESSEDASGTRSPGVASTVKQLEDVRDRTPSSDPPPRSFNPSLD